MSKSAIYYALILLSSIVFLIVGSSIAGRSEPAEGLDARRSFAGVVEVINDRFQDEWRETVNFDVRITDRGDRRGQIITVTQFVELAGERAVIVGDRVIIAYNPWFGENFHFINIATINQIVVLGIIFLILAVFLGRLKGLNGIISLAFSCVAVFMIFIPAVLSGSNVYVVAIIVCIYVIVSTLLLVIGPNKKAMSAMLGCFGGVIAAMLIMLIMNATLNLTGLVDHEAAHLYHESPFSLDMRALIFAGIIFGAVGAIMDVSMSIASALWELREAGGVRNFKTLVKSGIAIGQDTLGTMLNTLVLAYMGSSLALILLLVSRDTSMNELLNMEQIITEFLRALIGSFGMLLTIPLTAVICGWFFSGDISRGAPHLAKHKRK